MDKDEILKKTKNEGSDERVESVWLDIFIYSGIVAILSFVVFIVKG